MTSSGSPARRGITARRFASHAEADRYDAEFWRQLSAHDRVMLVWRRLLERRLEPRRFPEEIAAERKRILAGGVRELDREASASSADVGDRAAGLQLQHGRDARRLRPIPC